MPELRYAKLTDRRLIEIGGADARTFLQNLITTDIDAVHASGAGSGALLTPQGKILFDFLIYLRDGLYVLDTPAEAAQDLLKRLTFYRLRAKVDLSLLPEDQTVVAIWGGGDLNPGTDFIYPDPRLPALGCRLLASASAVTGDAIGQQAEEQAVSGYHAHRIACGVPEGLKDFDYSDIFPHDANLDQLGSVSFTKGCYVGQEVVSRMEHRATARKRFIKVIGSAAFPEKGSEIEASGKSIGTLGSSFSSGAANQGLALIRLDKAAQALQNGQSISCGGAAIELELPDWASFTWPETEAQQEHGKVS